MTRKFLTKNKIQFLMAFGAVLLLGACAAKHAAVERIEKADIALRESQQTEAAKYSSAELLQAREKLDAAKKAKEDGDYKASIQQADESIINTQLAQAKMLSEKTREDLKDSRKNTENLRKESQRQRNARQANQ